MVEHGKRDVATAVLWGLVAVLVAGVVTAVINDFIITERIRATQLAVAATTQQIEDCATPGGACYEDQRKLAATSVSEVNRVVVLAASCADRPERQTVTDIQTCVIDKLAEAKR